MPKQEVRFCALLRGTLAATFLTVGLFQYAVAAADPNKVIRTYMEAADDGFDPQRSVNLYTHRIAEAIFERLLTYDYVARPAKLVPLTAEAMPEVADGGKTYTFHIRKGIYFAPDPAFKGQRRELTARDYEYTYKRLLDPTLRSPAASMLEGKIVGLDALAAQAKKSGHYDYDAPVAGLEVLDRYTLRVRLNRTDYNFLYVVAYGALGALAREVMEAYGQQTGAHPVGTGPYRLKEYVPRSKIVLEANPDFRGFVWDFKSTGDAWDDQMVRDMSGKQMPQVGRVEVAIIEEDQSIWLAFEGKQLDYFMLPNSVAPIVLDGIQLKPEFTAQGIRNYRMSEPEITYTIFDFNDPVVGGYTLDKIALRRAMAMAYNVREEIALIRKSQATKAEMMVPAGMVGYDPSYRSSIPYDPDLANRLLDHFGYKRGSDGYRTLPDGRPLVLQMWATASSVDKEYGELWKRDLDVVGLHLNINVSNFADNLKAATECKLAVWQSAWYADYPEAEDWVMLLYGPNSHQSNNGCYQSKTYDALYERFVATPPGPERNALVIEMTRQMEADSAWVLHSSRMRNWLARPWVKGFKRHPILQSDWQYLDVEAH